MGLILSVMLNWQHGIETPTFAVRYSLFLTCFMAFAFGALVAHYRVYLQRWCAPWLSAIMWLAHCLVWLRWDQWPWTWGLYLSLLLTAWVLVSFSDRKPHALDRWLGDLSYPVYLFHTVMAVWWFGLFGMQRNLGFMLAGLFSTLALSLLVVVLLDRPLEKRFKRRRLFGHLAK